MDSLDAQCLLIDLVAREMPPPGLWHHSLTGELSCAYSQAGQAFTWRPEEVAVMARAWRESPARRVHERARPFIAAHRRLGGILVQRGLEPADVIVHDFDRNELRARWDGQRAVVVIEISAHVPSKPKPAAAGDSRSS